MGNLQKVDVIEPNSTIVQIHQIQDGLQEIVDAMKAGNELLRKKIALIDDEEEDAGRRMPQGSEVETSSEYSSTYATERVEKFRQEMMSEVVSSLDKPVELPVTGVFEEETVNSAFEHPALKGRKILQQPVS